MYARVCITVEGGVRANMLRYPLQKIEMVFLSGEINGVRHLVDVNPHVHTPLETKTSFKRHFSLEYYLRIVVITKKISIKHSNYSNRHVIVYNKHCVDILVIDSCLNLL